MSSETKPTALDKILDNFRPCDTEEAVTEIRAQLIAQFSDARRELSVLRELCEANREFWKMKAKSLDEHEFRRCALRDAEMAYDAWLAEQEKKS